MGFQSIDELNQFSFEDCQISSFVIKEEGLYFEVEALIVKPQNSQNTNYTESYAGTTQIRLQGASVTEAFEEGHRYYDANDRLVEEIPDRAIEKSEIDLLQKACVGGFLFAMEERGEREGKKCLALGIELPGADEVEGEISKTYQLNVIYEKAIVNWERYMNRVQR